MARKYLTPRERREMLERQGGKCAECGDKIDGTGKTCIAEHTWPVAQGNTGKPDCLNCIPCAKRKTHGNKATTAGSDIANIAKAKRIAAGGRKVKQPFRKPPPGYKTQWPKRRFGE